MRQAVAEILRGVAASHYGGQYGVDAPGHCFGSLAEAGASTLDWADRWEYGGRDAEIVRLERLLADSRSEMASVEHFNQVLRETLEANAERMLQVERMEASRKRLQEIITGLQDLLTKDW